MGPLIMIHAWVHLSASLQPPLNTLTAGHSITSDSVSPICVTGTKTYDSPPQPTAPVSEVINFSSSRCGDGDPGNMGRGRQSLMSVICMMHVWHQDDPEMTHGHWPPSHLIGTQRRSPHGIMATGMTLGHPGLGSYSIGTGNGSWLCLIHFIIPGQAPLSSPRSPVSFNWFITTMRGDEESLTTAELGPAEKGNSLCQWNDS